MENPRESAVADSRPPAERRTPRHNRAAPVPKVTDQHADPADLKNPALYINRELSWLEFNERVLDQARDPSHPLLERVKFLGITGTNLDEFFMIRVATTLKKLREDTFVELEPAQLAIDVERRVLEIRRVGVLIRDLGHRCGAVLPGRTALSR